MSSQSIASLRWRARADIDQAAGDARTRYITEVAGQQATYMKKEQQALDYVAAHALDAQATVPPYIAAEATAMGTTALAAAQQVLALAAQWNEVLGPAIEGARLAGKRAVDEAAGTEEAIEAARVAARAALEAI